MYVLKVPKKNVQKVKKELINKSLFAKDYEIIRDDNFIYLPVIDKNKVKELFSGYEVVKRDIKKLEKITNIRDYLKGKLTDEEFSKLKTAYDVVGSIAILEIDDELVKKEKIIAEAVLKTNKAIKTVLRKASKHDGVFRTQKMKWLAGEKTKEALHKENDVEIMVDVENIYFSPRLSTERKRISELVKEGEDVLVMFSGCAPYPCVLGKNTKARNIFGVEINPIGHKYGLDNVRLNKLHNVVLINGDVKKVVPNIYHYIIGLKSSDKEKHLQKRLKYHPTVMELHLFNSDLFEGREKLEKTIAKLQEQGIQVVVHMPFHDNGKRYSLGQKIVKNELKMLNELGKLCKKFHIKAVVHPTQDIGIAEDEDMLVNNIKKIEKYFDYFYFENLTHGIFAKAEDIVRIGKRAGIKNMCIDTCHLFIVYQDNDKIEQHIKKIKKHFNTYFHLNDHDYVTHSCEIGKGYVDFSRILPYVNLGVTEIVNHDENNPVEMIKSYLKVQHEPKKFDRILMPLPKSAENFLDTALKAAKKGTVIHFYDFLHKDEFHKAEEKAKKACLKHKFAYKKLELVKCGQHAPHTYRVCLDFKVM